MCCYFVPAVLLFCSKVSSSTRKQGGVTLRYKWITIFIGIVTNWSSLTSKNIRGSNGGSSPVGRDGWRRPHHRHQPAGVPTGEEAECRRTGHGPPEETAAQRQVSLTCAPPLTYAPPLTCAPPPHLCPSPPGFFSLVPSRWSKFHGDLNNYKRKLEAALVVHGLIRELEEVRDRAHGKVSHVMSPSDPKPPRAAPWSQNKSPTPPWKRNLILMKIVKLQKRHVQHVPSVSNDGKTNIEAPWAVFIKTIIYYIIL